MSAGEVDVAGAMITVVVEFPLGRYVQLVVVYMTTNSNFLIEAGGERGAHTLLQQQQWTSLPC